MSVFDGLGVLVALYVAYAAASGEVIAKSGPWMQRVARSERPRYFWAVIAVYAALAAALVLVF